MLAILLAGCWSFRETPYPITSVTPAGGSSVRLVALTGFEVQVTDYQAVQNYQSVYVPDNPWRGGGFFETVPTVTYIPQSRVSDLYLRRAKDKLEMAGYRIAAAGTPAEGVVVEVHFDGPIRADGYEWSRLGWQLMTLFFCDRDEMTWTAQLRMRDAKTGELLLRQDYSQAYEVRAAGVVPVFGASSCARLSSSAMQDWCLSALTDQIVADVTTFFANTTMHNTTAKQE